jgi:hypothetical protein
MKKLAGVARIKGLSRIQRRIRLTNTCATPSMFIDMKNPTSDVDSWLMTIRFPSECYITRTSLRIINPSRF